MNPIVHLEIPAPDLDAARAFYGELFEWTFHEAGPDYTIFSTGEGSIGGGFDRQMEPSDRGINVYIQVDDIPGTLARITQHGGSALAEKTKISDEHGFYGIFKDPNGNRLGIWSKT